MKKLFLLLAATLAVIGASYATAAITSAAPPPVIYACQLNNIGTLRAVANPTLCSAKYETPISWNQQGPVGQTGGQGAPGPQGPPGSGNTLTQSHYALLDDGTYPDFLVIPGWGRMEVHCNLPSPTDPTNLRMAFKWFNTGTSAEIITSTDPFQPSITYDSIPAGFSNSGHGTDRTLRVVDQTLTHTSAAKVMTIRVVEVINAPDGSGPTNCEIHAVAFYPAGAPGPPA